MRVTQSLLSLLVAVCLVAFLGCDSGKKTAKAPTSQSDNGHSEDEHGDDHDHPETYDAAVAELQELTAAIQAGFEKDDVESAHEPLHEVGHILEIIDDLVKQSDLDDDVKKSLREAVNNLFESFGAVDDKQHGLEGKEFKDVSAQIDADIKKLTDQVGDVAGTLDATETPEPSEAPGEVPEVSEVTKE